MSDAPLTLDPHKSALLLMDYQQSVVANFAKDESLLPRAAGVLRAAREAGVRVIYVGVEFRPGYPEVSPNNQRFSALQGSSRFLQDDPGTRIHPAVAPREGEVLVTKHRVSAFFGTDLDIILRANGIETLVLAGIATSGVVLSTLRHAADADYRCLVIEDCCADGDPEVHACLTKKVFPRQATVISAADLLKALGAPTP